MDEDIPQINPVQGIKIKASEFDVQDIQEEIIDNSKKNVEKYIEQVRLFNQVLIHKVKSNLVQTFNILFICIYI